MLVKKSNVAFLDEKDVPLLAGNIVEEVQMGVRRFVEVDL
jgi:hypothetical protein